MMLFSVLAVLSGVSSASMKFKLHTCNEWWAGTDSQVVAWVWTYPFSSNPKEYHMTRSSFPLDNWGNDFETNDHDTYTLTTSSNDKRCGVPLHVGIQVIGYDSLKICRGEVSWNCHGKSGSWVFTTNSGWIKNTYKTWSHKGNMALAMKDYQKKTGKTGRSFVEIPELGEINDGASYDYMYPLFGACVVTLLVAVFAFSRKGKTSGEAYDPLLVEEEPVEV